MKDTELEQLIELRREVATLDRQLYSPSPPSELEKQLREAENQFTAFAKEMRGQRWLSPQNGEWVVIGVDTLHVQLSGPGPCRSVKTVKLGTFCLTWERVNGV